MESEEEKKPEGKVEPIIPAESPSFDWNSLGVSEFKGEETVSELKALIEKGKMYDEVSPYKEKYAYASEFLEHAANPMALFADGEVGLKREQLKTKYPFLNSEMATKVANNGEGLSHIEAMAIEEFVKSGSTEKYSDIVDALNETYDIDPEGEIDSKTRIRLRRDAEKSLEYIKSLNADIKVPELAKFDDFIATKRQEREGLDTELTTLWTDSITDVKRIVKENPIDLGGAVTFDNIEYTFDAKLELDDEDLASLDGSVASMVKSRTPVTQESLLTIDTIVKANALLKKFPTIAAEIATQAISKYKQNFNNPNLPLAKEKPAGVEVGGSTNEERAASVSAWISGLSNK